MVLDVVQGGAAAVFLVKPRSYLDLVCRLLLLGAALVVGARLDTVGHAQLGAQQVVHGYFAFYCDHVALLDAVVSQDAVQVVQALVVEDQVEQLLLAVDDLPNDMLKLPNLHVIISLDFHPVHTVFHHYQEPLRFPNLFLQAYDINYSAIADPQLLQRQAGVLCLIQYVAIAVHAELVDLQLHALGEGALQLLQVRLGGHRQLLDDVAVLADLN